MPDDVNDRTIESKTIEAILSEHDTNKLDTPYDGNDETKPIAAMEFRSKVMSGEIEMDEVTRKGFVRLFNELDIKVF